MSGKTRNTIGAVFATVGSIVSYFYPVAGLALVAIGSWLSYDGQKRMQREAERRARAGFRANSVKGNVRGSHEHHQIVFGEGRVGGLVVAAGTEAGPDMPNQYLYIGIAHSIAHAGGCEGVTGIWLDDTFVSTASMSGDPNAGEVDVNAGVFSGLVRLRHYRGTGTQGSDATLVAAAVDAASSYRRGIAWTWARLKRTTDEAAFRAAFKFGIPILSAKLKGVRVYDPRLDSTNGGSGTQRVDDVLTWAWSNNPILCAATYSIMQVSDGGMGVPHARIDWPSVAAAASVCDETISTPAGNAARFSCNGVISTADKREVNLQKILDSCLGKRVRVGGKYKFFAACARATAGEIDATWLAGAFTITPLEPLESLYNAVRVNLDDASQEFKTVEAPLYTSTAYEAQDNGQRIFADLNLPMVSNVYQAQYIAQIHHKRSRDQMTVMLHCNLKALDMEVWETYKLNLPDSGIDLTGYTFRIHGMDLAEDGIRVTLKADSSSVYTVDTMATPAGGTSATAGGETPPQMTGLTATSAPNGVLLRWNAPPAYMLPRVLIERSATGGGSGFSQIGIAGANEAYFDTKQFGGTWYYRVRAQSWSANYGAYSAEASATAMLAGDQSGLFVMNGNFESGDVEWAKDAGWTIVADATNARGSSDRCAKLPGTGASQTVAITNSRRVPISPGDIVEVRGYLKSTASADGTGKIAARYYDSIGSYLSDDAGNNIAGGTTTYSGSRKVSTAPANAAYVSAAYIVASFTSSSANAWFADDTVLFATTKEAYNLTVAGSGQRLGDARNVIMAQVGGMVGVPSTSALSAVDAGATTSINVEAFSLQAGGAMISYNAVSNAATGLGFTTKYWVYANDPTYAGGTLTWTATTNPVTASIGDGRIILGPITTPADSGAPTAPYMDPACVAADSWMASGEQAIRVKPGDVLLHRTDKGACALGEVEMAYPAVQACVEIETTSGARLICSTSTPFTLRDGSSRLAPEMLGQAVLVQRGGDFRWERVSKVNPAGDRQVMRISVGGHSYPAGTTRDALVFSHNVLNKN